MLEAGAAKNVADGGGIMPLDLACKSGHCDIAAACESCWPLELTRTRLTLLARRSVHPESQSTKC